MSDKQQSPRKSSWSSKSFHSIDQFRYSTPGILQGGYQRFPIRPTVNILIILLTTLQVFLLISSRIYLRGELVRTFLSVYLDQTKHPEVFDGKQFYIQIIEIQQLKDHFQYMFKRVNVIEQDSFVDFYYKDANFLLHTEYRQFAGSQHRTTVHPINPKKGIRQPFDMTNITDIQLYLLQVEEFQIRIQNLTMKQNWEGFSEKYLHQITYQYVDSIKVQVNFNFKINNAMVRYNSGEVVEKHSNMEDWISMATCIKGGCYFKHKGNLQQNDNLQQVPFPTAYIVKVRIFYSIVFLFSLISLYLNFVSIRKIYKIFYDQLQYVDSANNADEQQQSPIEQHVINKQQQQQMRRDIKKWLKVNNITVAQIKLEHYFHIIQFDVIFSTLSNIFQIIAAFYLLTGNQKERIAGLVCLFSWLTIFKFIRSYKKLSLMYQLIKLSITKVVRFFIQFLPVFLSYALLGLCLFPKVSFFSSLANSVTTLVCLMMGDSIQMITDAILQKNAAITAIIYIFSFVLLFMHGIHNTLTSLIKQFFIIKKIQLVRWEKENNKDQAYVYMGELHMKSDVQKAKLPLKLTPSLAKVLLRIKAKSRTKFLQKATKYLCHELESINLTQKWMINQDHLYKFPQVKQELVRRSLLLDKIIKQFDEEDTGKNKKTLKKSFRNERESLKDGIKESLLTEINNQ